MNKEIATAQKLVEIGSEVAELDNSLAKIMMQMMILSQAVSAIQARVQAVTHHVLDAPPPQRFEENTSFGLAQNRENRDGAASLEKEPPTHDGGEAAHSADMGSDDWAPGIEAPVSAEPPQSEQAVYRDAPAEVGASLEYPAIYDLVLHRFAETGHSHNELAEAFDVRLAVISQCLTIARGRNDRRAAAGDLKRSELMEGKEPVEPVKASRVKRSGDAKGPEMEPVQTVTPWEGEVGNPILMVSYTDGVATRHDTHQDVRLPGPLLRILAYLKDQRWYPVKDVMQAGRIVAEPIFRTKLQELQRGLGRIGLHIVEDADRGFQLRRIAPSQDSADAA